MFGNFVTIIYQYIFICGDKTKPRGIFAQRKNKYFLQVVVKQNMLSISWEMYAGVSEEPKDMRCLASVDIRYEYPISLPQSYSLIH